MKFDHTKKYYCVIQDNYDSETMEKIANGSGIIKVDEPLFYFDSLRNIGKFLYLGKSVRELKIPEDASILKTEDDRSYQYATDKVDLLGILTIEDVINRLDDPEDNCQIELNLSDHKFSNDFVFPKKIESLTLTRCHIPSNVKLPENVNSYHADCCTFNTLEVVPGGSINNIHINKTDMDNCNFRVENGGHVSFSDAKVFGMTFTGNAESINISDAIIKDLSFKDFAESIVISNSEIREVNFPPEVEYLFFINSKIGEDIKLPQRVGTFRVLGCTYENEEVKNQMDDLRNNSEW